LIDIIKAVDSNYQITDCMKENGSSIDCAHFDCCKIRDPLVVIQKKIDKVFFIISAALIFKKKLS